ncbi:early nodulin-like protein 7 [Raphanus sativus]|uniref:Early nodulin-like protein 7 n=1 Tax=Raphanus sativus TaxID=3726 RepID=A0A6J0K336_RAPSA|nr:early nodulin-like protein 7 [Raphanus sativus]KAJ4884825.1 early nodulin-like protein 7 [Raphanus sativus]
MMKMTSLLMIILLCIQCAVMVASEGGPRVFKVGDEFQWKVPLQNDTSVYSRWASTNRFHIGDSLSFVYDKDSVMEVEKEGFYHCNASDPITAFDNGNSTFILDRPGLFYFISGSDSHCTSGQRLIVEVMHIHHHHSNHHASLPPSMSPLSPASSPSSSAFDSHDDPASSSAASSLLASFFLPFAALLVALFCFRP